MAFSRRRIVVLGTMAADPYAGMAWMHMQIAAGLLRLGHDVYYLETSSFWPYDPVRGSFVCDSEYAVPYLARVAERFGLGDRWAYRRSYSDRAWLGPAGPRGEALLVESDAVLNVGGATRLAEDHLTAKRLVYFGTDPVIHELGYANGDPVARAIVDEHEACVTYGENIGTPGCPIPPLPRLRAHTRQAVLLDRWPTNPPSRRHWSTVANWKQTGKDLVFEGETYFWSKHHEFQKFLDLPRRVQPPIELAFNLAALDAEIRAMLEGRGFTLGDAASFTTDPFPYHDFVCASRGEWTVAKDQNVRLNSGWFSERSACYLAAGRPVITQNTGFGRTLPTGEGLFAFDTLDEIVAAFEAVEADYERHSRAARRIAEEYFDAEKVLARLLQDLGL
jgi:hypothetical protein